MTDLIVGLALVLVIEGLLWAAFPTAARHMLEAVAQMGEGNLRMGGAIAILVGVGVVWLVRG